MPHLVRLLRHRDPDIFLASIRRIEEARSTEAAASEKMAKLTPFPPGRAKRVGKAEPNLIGVVEKRKMLIPFATGVGKSRIDSGLDGTKSGASGRVAFSYCAVERSVPYTSETAFTAGEQAITSAPAGARPTLNRGPRVREFFVVPQQAPS